MSADPVEVLENRTVRRAPQPIIRFTLQDMPEWGKWLLDRCQIAWPNFRREAWTAKLHMLASSNDFLFVRNDRAVICISSTPRTMDGASVLLEVFAWSRDAVPQKWRSGRMLIDDKSEDEWPLIYLYRYAQTWAKTRKAARLFIGQCSDMTPARLRDLLKGDECKWVSLKV